MHSGLGALLCAGAIGTCASANAISGDVRTTIWTNVGNHFGSSQCLNSSLAILISFVNLRTPVKKNNRYDDHETLLFELMYPIIKKLDTFINDCFYNIMFVFAWCFYENSRKYCKVLLITKKEGKSWYFGQFNWKLVYLGRDRCGWLSKKQYCEEFSLFWWI